jgi:hypothetical protein
MKNTNKMNDTVYNQGMIQFEVTPTIVAGVCDPGVPIAAGYKAARAQEPECYPRTGVLNHATIKGEKITGALLYSVAF